MSLWHTLGEFLEGRTPVVVLHLRPWRGATFAPFRLTLVGPHVHVFKRAQGQEAWLRDAETPRLNRATRGQILGGHFLCFCSPFLMRQV